MKVTKTRIIAEVDEGCTVMHFTSSEVALPHEVEKVLQEIQEVADQVKTRLLVVNFTRVRHVSSAFFGKLIALQKGLSGKGIQLRLCCMSSDAENAYNLLNLRKLIPLYATEEAALQE